VNNAGYFEPDLITGAPPETIIANCRVHALSPLVLARRLAEQTDDGCVINMLDTRVAAYDRRHASYHLSKRMLLDITRILAMELAPGIRVNAVAPGVVLPPEGEDESWFEKMKDYTLLKRHGCAADITEAGVFLVRSDFVTGQVIYVDGGRRWLGNGGTGKI
jgi:NAD(P)-dependent dehydrogenase (short-subunit alcohol dehydrogenase family)